MIYFPLKNPIRGGDPPIPLNKFLDRLCGGGGGGGGVVGLDLVLILRCLQIKLHFLLL